MCNPLTISLRDISLPIHGQSHINTEKACHLRVGLLSVFMTRLEDGVLHRSEETFRSVSGFLSLLQCFHGDMHPDFQRDLVSFFCGRFAKLQEMRCNPLHRV